MTTAITPADGAGEFITVPGDRRSEAPLTLAGPVPRALSSSISSACGATSE